MLSSWFKGVLLLVGLAMACSAATARAQTDVGLSLYGAFHGTTNGNGTIQSPSNSAGGMVELRHISNPLVGYELTYSYNRANQVYSSSVSSGLCPVGVTPPCGPLPVPVSANAHQIAANWIVSVHAANLRPFALAGVGVLFHQPTSGQSNTTSDTKGVFVYGAGLDWGLLGPLGLRFQYRGNLYKAPDLTKLYTSTDAFTHTAEPMIGAYFRF